MTYAQAIAAWTEALARADAWWAAHPPPDKWNPFADVDRAALAEAGRVNGTKGARSRWEPVGGKP